jgi:hypothetical protein
MDQAKRSNSIELPTGLRPASVLFHVPGIQLPSLENRKLAQGICEGSGDSICGIVHELLHKKKQAKQNTNWKEVSE